MNILQLMPNRNNPFDNFIQRTYQPQTPQNRLQMAYEQAMAKRTPEWARTVSDMMPSIAEMVAYGTTKGAFNQGRIVDALEREKQRRTAYNQMMRENEDKQVNDYVQMAKEQLGMDMALDEKEYKKAIDQLNRDERLEAQKRAYEQYTAEQEQKAQQRAEDVDFRERKFKFEQDEAEKNRIAEQQRAEAEALAKKQAEEQKQAEAEEKKREEKIKQTQSLLDSYNSAGAIEPKDYLALRKLAATNPDKVYELLQDSGNYKESGLILGFLPWKTAGNKNKFKLGVNLDNKNTKGL